MKCEYCGCEVRDDAKFCPICGAKFEQKETVEAEVISEEVKQEKRTQAKCWTVFCKVARILGYLSFIPLVGLYTGPCGVVFSILGKHSDNQEAQNMRKPALVCSIIGFCFNITIYTIIIVIVELLLFGLI